MTIFQLTVQQTYYAQGFFNVTREFDQYVRNTEGPVDLVLGDSKQTVKGRIDRRANLNGTARIHGGAPLRDWFQANFQPLEKVKVDFSSVETIRISRPLPALNWRDYVTVDPEICHGRACVSGTRIMVSIVLDNLAAGLSPDDILDSYPSLNMDAIHAVLGYAAELARERIIPVPA